jgi:PKHD-type hydroxylase
MLIQIGDVLDAVTVGAMRETLDATATYVDGTATAGWHARLVKRNLQVVGDDDAVRGVLRKTEAALMDHPVFRAAAQPRAFARTMVNRYEPGMEYGPHVDAAVMDGMRTDVSFTVFLSDADSYDGGELVVDSADAERRVKLPAGAAVVYPATSLHRVAPVTSGVRLAVVGWVQSRIRRAEEREILFDLQTGLTELFEHGGKSPAFDRLAKVQANLVRLWSAD